VMKNLPLHGLTRWLVTRPNTYLVSWLMVAMMLGASVVVTVGLTSYASLLKQEKIDWMSVLFLSYAVSLIALGIVGGRWAVIMNTKLVFAAAIAAIACSIAGYLFVFRGSLLDETVFWRLEGICLAALLGSVSAWGAITSRKVRDVLRTELPNWPWLLADVTREIASAKGKPIWFLSYSPNIGDISLEGMPEHYAAYVPFERALSDFAASGECNIICQSERSLMEMLRSLRVYADKRRDTYRLIYTLEASRQCAVWRADQIPPQHLLVIGERVGYRFLVAADLVGRRHRVRAIRTEDRAEIEHMLLVWRRCSSQLAAPVAGNTGFWLSVDGSGAACLWGQFNDQLNAVFLEVQTAEKPTDFEPVGPRDNIADAQGWRFEWALGGLFQGKHSHGTGPARLGAFFRTRIVKEKVVRPPASAGPLGMRGEKVQFRSEWSDPFRMFLPAVKGLPAVGGIEDEARNAVRQVMLSATQKGLTRDRFTYEFVHSYPPRALLTKLDNAGIGNLFDRKRHLNDPKGYGTEEAISIYVHVPFCDKICTYCHYRRDTWDARRAEAYVECLVSEIHRSTSMIGSRRKVSAVYFGGGTPTLLLRVHAPGHGDKNGLDLVLDALNECFAIESDCEKTVECEPQGIVGDDTLKGLLDRGINRLSIGVQTFEPSLLRDLGRQYPPETAAAVIRRANECDFREVNVDLLYGLPAKTNGRAWLQQWKYTVGRVCEVMPPCITFYQLRVKHGTGLADSNEWKNEHFPEEEDILVMSQMGRDILERVGYQEIAPEFYILDELTEKRARDNGAERTQFFCYQGQKASNQPFLGFGLSAYSYFNGCIWYNVGKLDDYMACPKKDQLPIDCGCALSEEDMWRRYGIMGLRYGNGIDLAECEARYGSAGVASLRKTAREIADEPNPFVTVGSDRIELTRQGRLYVDEICRRLYSKEVVDKLGNIGRRYGTYSTPGRGEKVKS